MQKLILLGGGGHCKSCIDVIEQEGVFEVSGILDSEDNIGKDVLGYKFIGTDNDIVSLASENYMFLITVGQVKTSSVRKNIFLKLTKSRAQMATVVSPRAYVSKHASIGKGTIVMHGALVNASVTIGENCIVNTNALIEHDSMVEDFCHISTSAVINGGVKIGEGSFIGSNAVSRECVEICRDSFIKAGSVYKGES